MNALRGAYVKGLCCKETKESCGTEVERRIVQAVWTKESWKVRRISDSWQNKTRKQLEEAEVV